MHFLGFIAVRCGSNRSADEVISHAIRENRIPENLLYTFAIVFVITGEILIFWALIHGSGLNAASGVALNGSGSVRLTHYPLNGLAWPAYAQTRKLRKENLKLRMLEVPLSKAKTAEEAAKTSTESFAQEFKPDAPAKPAAQQRGKK